MHHETNSAGKSSGLERAASARSSREETARHPTFSPTTFFSLADALRLHQPIISSILAKATARPLKYALSRASAQL